MHRRNFLTKLSTAAGAAVVASTAGCGGNANDSTTGPNDAPAETATDQSGGSTDGAGTDAQTATRTRQDSTVTTDTPLATAVVAKQFDFKTAEDGHLIVTVPVENRADDKQTETMVVEVTADGTKYEQSTELTLAAGEERTVEVDFPDVDMAETGSISVSISFEG